MSRIVAEDESTAHARMNLHFMNGTTEIETIIIKNSDTRQELNTIIYDPGVGDIPKGTIFKGWWVSDANEDKSAKRPYSVEDAENGMDIDEVRDWADSITITENEDRYVYAMLYKNFVMNYIDENGVSVGSENVFILQSDASADYEVNMTYVPKDDEHDFQGWFVSEGGDNIEGYTQDTLYKNGQTITVKGSVTFSVNAPEGHWLVFDENGKGAKYNAPQFIKSGESPVEPDRTLMTRFGYSFGGWYKAVIGEEDETGYKTVDESQPFEFEGTTLTDKTTIYAKWNPKETASYSVIIWKQNVAGDGYDFGELRTLSGNVGSTIDTVRAQGSGDGAYASVNGTPIQYTGFHLNKFDQDVSIATEGNSVVNVYYDRTEYTLSFLVYDYTYTPTTSNSGTQYGLVDGEYVQLYRHGRNNNYYWTYNDSYYSEGPRYTGTRYTRSNPSWHAAKNITAKYGTNIINQFPISGYESYIWESQGGNTFKRGLYIVMADLMPAENVTFRGQDAGSAFKMQYWLQPESLSTNHQDYELANTITAYDSSFYLTYEEDFMEMHGFDRESSNPTFQDGEIEHSGPGTMTVDFFYKRSIYPIAFMDGIYVDGDGNKLNEANMGQLHTENKAYGSDISSFNNFVPDTTHTGYVFDGWYMDKDCTREYTFGKMPMDGLTVYAKWRQIQYRLFLHPNVDSSDKSLDWGSENQKMNFRISLNGTLSAPTGRRAEYEFVGWYTSPELDAASLFNSDIKLNEDTVTTPYDKTKDFTDPMDKWGNIGPNPTNSDIDRPWITKKLDLYGKWRAKLLGAKGIGIHYELDDGEGHIGTGQISDTNTYLDDAEATAQAAPTAPEGYRFVKWHVQTWDQESKEYVDKGIEVYPGDAFDVLKSDAKVLVTEWAKTDAEGADYITIESPEPGTTPPNPEYPVIKKATYTVQLQAEYVPEGTGAPSHIYFYANNQDKDQNLIPGVTIGESGTEPKDEKTYKEIVINQAYDILSIASVLGDSTLYDNYKFLGWAKTRDASEPWLTLNADGRTYTVVEDGKIINNATQIAADEKEPYDNLYAVWERQVRLVIKKDWKDGFYNNNYKVTVTYGSGTDEEVVLTKDNSWEDSVLLPVGKEVTVTETKITLEGSAANYITDYDITYVWNYIEGGENPEVTEAPKGVLNENTVVVIGNKSHIEKTGIDIDNAPAKAILFSTFMMTLITVIGYFFMRKRAFLRR